ncbi:hypothetical protein QYF36_020065 [Acer negundo]|nr:hypothetical protein QYF36_020065 [Acer negundo]
MLMIGFIPMTYLRWEFAGNLTNESIITSWSNNSFCCQWDGVVCEKEGNESVATRLILPKKGLKGIISRSLGRLDKLKLLDLSCNHFEGVLPAELSNLKQLQVLYLSHNMLMGRVSQVLSSLKMIQSLNVSSNSFSGDLLELGGFPNLLVFNILDLSMNNFAGNLQGLDNCSYSLKELHVDVNSLSGHLPGSLYSFPSLQQLSRSENYFSGHLSKELTLVFLFLQVIVFSGPLPNSLADCHQLKILNLDKNNLTGQVPDNFAKLQSLLFLSLSNNSFVDISRALSVLQQCKNLTALIFAKNVNGFESLMALGIGEIPTNLTELKSLISTNSSNLTSAAGVPMKEKKLVTPQEVFKDVKKHIAPPVSLVGQCQSNKGAADYTINLHLVSLGQIYGKRGLIWIALKSCIRLL